MRAKIILLYIVCIISTSCDPHMFDFDKCFWRIENNTDKYIVLNMFVGQNIDSRDIAAGEYISIQTVLFSLGDGIPFEYALENKDSITIAVNGQPIKKIWRKSDLDKSGRHFFNQSSWTLYTTPRHDSFENYIFTFTIENEDLN